MTGGGREDVCVFVALFCFFFNALFKFWLCQVREETSSSVFFRM